MNLPNYALYYPSIEFQDYRWLWSASLIWDRIYRIVPQNYKPEDPKNIQSLTETGEIGIPIRPDAYTREVAQEFVDKIDTGKWSAAALEFDMSEAYAKLHQDKVDVELRNVIIARGRASEHDQWLYVPTEFESLYMTFLAGRVAEKNDLQLVSDSAAAWTGSTYFGYDGEIEDFPREDLSQQLATLVVRDFIPTNVLEIRPDQLIAFRGKYRDERARFVSCIREMAKAISDSEDANVYNDRVEDIKSDIESAVSDYRRSMCNLNVAGWTGITSICFPVAREVASAMAGKDLDVTTLHMISALGIGLGLVAGISALDEKRKSLERACDFSYLIHVSRDLKGVALYGKDYNYFLCRQMEEFIND